MSETQFHACLVLAAGSGVCGVDQILEEVGGNVGRFNGEGRGRAPQVMTEVLACPQAVEFLKCEIVQQIDGYAHRGESAEHAVSIPRKLGRILV